MLFLCLKDVADFVHAGGKVHLAHFTSQQSYLVRPAGPEQASLARQDLCHTNLHVALQS